MSSTPGCELPGRKGIKKMRYRIDANAEPDEPASLLTAGMVLALYGLLTGIGSIGWAATATLFILAAVAVVAGLVLRYAQKN